MCKVIILFLCLCVMYKLIIIDKLLLLIWILLFFYCIIIGEVCFIFFLKDYKFFKIIFNIKFICLYEYLFEILKLIRILNIL